LTGGWGEENNKSKIIVIEREHEGTKTERLSFWQGKLNKKIELIQMTNILDFQDWDNV
jgi:hypothetical protein